MFIKEVRPRTNILNTKLGKIKHDLSDIENQDNDSLAKIIEIVIKYNSINNIFTHNITYNKNDLIKIIEGKPDYAQDSNEGYNDHFFELSMAVRFLLSLKNSDKNSNAKINLDGVCDIIINDLIAIECKYIHSTSNIIKNIQKAKNQIDKRIADNQAKYGFIALDLSHICPKEKFKEFANYTLNKFIESYEILRTKGHIQGGILKNILDDRNFLKIISSYIMMVVETTLYSELGFSYDLGGNVIAIIFQSNNSFVFEYKDEVYPVPTRGMTYFLNPKLRLTNNKVVEIERFIHSLAVGI
jgi:hypothetical protein